MLAKTINVFLIIGAVFLSHAAQASSEAPLFAEKSGIFADTFYTETDRETESAQIGFHSKTHGFIGGFNAVLSEKASLGLAYTYSKTDVETADNDKADTDMHTVLLYGKYRLTDVFFTGAASFGWAKNDIEPAGATRETQTDSRIGILQMMSGYEFENSAPMYGFRYVHADDRGDVRKKTDIVTGIIKMRAAKTYRQGKNVTFTPDFSMGLTYDFIADNDTIMVLLPNGAGYVVDSKRLDRLGAEMSLGLVMGFGGKGDVSVDYIGAMKPDYLSHTLMLRATLRF